MEKKKRTRKPKVKTSDVADTYEPTKEITWETEEAVMPNEPIFSSEYFPESGITLIALENPYYCHMAANLAASIKSKSPDAHITLVKNQSSYSMMRDDVKHLFDNIIDCPEEYYNSIHGKDPFLAKLYLDKLTPYKKTLFFDADMIWMNRHSIDNLFSDLSGVEFTMSNRGVKDSDNIRDELKSKWVSIKDVTEVYGLRNVYDLASEVIYFEESFKATKIFETARTVYADNRINVNNFGQGKPDEVYFMISLGLNEVILHEQGWAPAYWSPNYFPRIHSRDYIQNFYLLSVGGAVYATPIKKIYDTHANSCFQRMGIRIVAYQLIHKRNIMKSRQTI